jgi:NhaP-type Na+/H+ or K+/H+ antiporter
LKDFANDFTVANISNTSIQLPVPNVPAAHTAVYTMAFQFALGVGLLEVLVLGMRLGLGSRIRRTTGTIGGIVFWFGAAYCLNGLTNMKSTLAVSQQQELWFQFWAFIIILIGVSIIVRVAVFFTAKAVRRS